MTQDAKTLMGHLRRLRHGDSPNVTDFFNDMLTRYFKPLSISRKSKAPFLSGTTLLFSVCPASDCALPWANIEHFAEVLFPMYGSREARDARRIWLWQTTPEGWHKLEDRSDWYRMGIEAMLSGRPARNDLEMPLVFGGSDYCFERLVLHMERAITSSNASRKTAFFKSEELCHSFSARVAEVVSAAPALSPETDSPSVKLLLRTDAQGWRNHKNATAEIKKFVLSQGGRFEVIQLKRSGAQTDAQAPEGHRTKEAPDEDLNEDHEDAEEEGDLALEWHAAQRPPEEAGGGGRGAGERPLALGSTSSNSSMRKLTLKEQIEAVSTADVLISAHGAQHTSVAFLRSGSAFVEVYHCLHRSPYFRGLSHDCGVSYYEARTRLYGREPSCDPDVAGRSSRRYLNRPTDLDFAADLQPALERALEEWRSRRRQ